MLSSLLSRKTCAECQNCCVFQEQSAWELPTFSAETVKRLKDRPELAITKEGERFRVALPYDESCHEQPCPFLDAHTGCTLPPEEKPFACSLWPVRVMKSASGETIFTLYRGCPGIPEESADAVRSLLKEGLGQRILEEIRKDPSLVLPYHENYLPLSSCPGIECQGTAHGGE